MRRARKAVENQNVPLRFEGPNQNGGLHVLRPQIEHDIVRHQLAPPHEFHHLDAKLAFCIHLAKHLSGREMIETRHHTQNFSPGALAGAGRAEQQNGVIQSGRCHLRPRLGGIVDESLVSEIDQPAPHE